MRYEGTVYRLPSEADTLLIQATIGCPHNWCALCGMYRTEKFRIRPVAEIKEELRMAQDKIAALSNWFCSPVTASALGLCTNYSIVISQTTYSRGPVEAIRHGRNVRCACYSARLLPD